LPVITIEQRIAIAILCAKVVYKDKQWNIWADKWLNGTDRSVKTAAYAAYANAAARATNAAYVYAAVYAANAAYAAAVAATAHAAAAYANAADAAAHAANVAAKGFDLLKTLKWR